MALDCLLLSWWKSAGLYVLLLGFRCLLVCFVWMLFDRLSGFCGGFGFGFLLPRGVGFNGCFVGWLGFAAVYCCFSWFAGFCCFGLVWVLVVDLLLCII